MSTLIDPTAPRPSTAPSSPARQVSGTSFLSRVQVDASGAVSPPATGTAPAVSGRAVVAQAIASAKDAAQAGSPSAPLTPEQQAVQEMTRSFLMGTMQSLFAGFGQSASQPDADE